ncbi:MAG: hypothetical protein AAFY78_18330 [Cyanobacteria bacterium J06648_16]
MGVFHQQWSTSRFVRRMALFVSLMTIVGCPQVISSQTVQPPEPVDDLTAVLTSAEAPTAVEATVCSAQPDWQRPSDAEQQKYLEADPRFAAAVSTESMKHVADRFWQHEVLSFTTYGLSARMEPMLLSGLWSAADSVWASCYEGDQATAINAGEIAETWLINHRLVEVTWQSDQYVMVVEPVASGLEVVHFNRVETEVSLPLVVVDGNGAAIETVSGDYE